MGNRLRSAGSILLVTAMLAACSQTGSGASPTGAGPTGAGPSGAPPTGSASGAAGGVPGPLQDEVTVRFGVFPNITHAPGLVALAEGGTLEQLLPNATIEVTPFNSGTTAVEAMFSDAIDITFVGPNPAINAFAQSDGEAVRIISGSTSGGAFLVVREDITSPQDLAGKKLATPSLGNTQDVALRAWLKEQGYATDTAGGGDVSVVPQENSQTLDTFIEGTIDGAWVPEPWATRLITEGGAHVLVDERDLWPEGAYVTTHLMVATSYLEENPEVIKRILLATIQAVDTVKDDPATAQATVNAEIEKFTTAAIGQDLLETAWGNLTFTVDPVASSLQKSADDAQALGILEDPGDLAGLYDLTLLNDLLESLDKEPVQGL